MLYLSLLWFYYLESWYFNSKSPSSDSYTIAMLTTNSQCLIIWKFLPLYSFLKNSFVEHKVFFMSHCQYVIILLLVSMVSGEKQLQSKGFYQVKVTSLLLQGHVLGCSDAKPAQAYLLQKTPWPHPGKISPCIVPAEQNFTQDGLLPLLVIFWLVTISKLCKLDYGWVQLCSR